MLDVSRCGAARACAAPVGDGLLPRAGAAGVDCAGRAWGLCDTSRYVYDACIIASPRRAALAIQLSCCPVCSARRLSPHTRVRAEPGLLLCCCCCNCWCCCCSSECPPAHRRWGWPTGAAVLCCTCGSQLLLRPAGAQRDRQDAQTGLSESRAVPTLTGAKQPRRLLHHQQQLAHSHAAAAAGGWATPPGYCCACKNTHWPSKPLHRCWLTGRWVEGRGSK